MKARVAQIQSVTANWYLLKLHVSAEVEFMPGQFMHIRTAEFADPLLRRPFSIHYRDPADNTVWILFQKVGRGTGAMANLSPGDTLDCLGPLGNNFETDTGDRQVMLVAGGVGIAPLYYLASLLQRQGTSVSFLVGGQTGSHLPHESYFHYAGIEPLVSTEDGSRGYHGMVTEYFRELLWEKNGEIKPERVFSCGPQPMLAEVVAEAKQAGVPTQVSLEAPMACGVGACLGCVCGIKDNGESAEIQYQRVCTEGPVFAGEKVVFGDE